MSPFLERHNVREGGQVVLLLALLLPVILALSGVVAGLGNWYVHARNLQTKADAGAFAGGTNWAFPCGSEIDTRIADAARLYAGSSNPQVGKVPDANIKVRLNALNWYDNDSNPGQGDFDNPNGSVCSALSLDVKATEDNAFPLLSLLPLFPDLKRRARVEIQKVAGATGLLPIAVRAPEPVSAAAVFYNEANGAIQAVKYFVKTDPLRGIPDILNLPGSTQGWTTQNPQDANFWANFSLSSANGVAIAISFRGACNTGLPSPNSNITTTAAPCFEDSGFSTVNQLCNQGSGTQIINCYYATGSWPTESVRAGLHFIRGYPDLSPGNGTPAVESAYLTSVSCAVNGTPSPAYFNAHPSSTCQARLTVKIDAGTIQGLYEPPTGNLGDLRAGDVQVRYRLVRGDGSFFCNYGVNCDLIGSGTGSNMTFSTQGNGTSPHLPLTAKSGANAVAIEVRIRNAPNHPNVDCRGQGLFSDNCRWFWTGTGMVSTSVPPIDATILAAPVQRAFRGSNVTSSTNVLWLRLTTDGQCDGAADYIDTDAASQPTGGNRCFFMEMGLKGGLAKNANEPAVLFNDGTATNQTGTVDCDPAIPQGQELEDGIVDGCNYGYGKHPFNYPGPNLCPAPNNLFTLPNPGPPWDDGSWPPLRCIDTRQTGTANQLENGLKLRFFGDKNTSSNPSGCPAAGPGYVKGRNYWDKDTANGYTGVPTLGYVEGSHQTNFDPRDPRIVTIFLSTTEAFTRPPGKTHPVTGFIRVYITGFGKVGDAINGNDDDPCPGSAPPPDLDSCSMSECNNYVIWGHILNYPIPSPNATPSGELCNPGTIDACVATLVE